MTVKQHMAKVAALGCILCRSLDIGETPAELHHQKIDGIRASDKDVIPLCVEHHRGMTGVHGLGRKAFERRYGLTEMDLLEMVKREVQP